SEALFVIGQPRRRIVGRVETDAEQHHLVPTYRLRQALLQAREYAALQRAVCTAARVDEINQQPASVQAAKLMACPRAVCNGIGGTARGCSRTSMRCAACAVKARNPSVVAASVQNPAARTNRLASSVRKTIMSASGGRRSSR